MQSEVRVFYPVRWFAEDKSEQSRVLVVIILADKFGRFHAVIHVLVKPLPAFGNSVHEPLDNLAMVTDGIFANRQHAGNKFGPDIFRLVQHAAVAVQLRLSHETVRRR